MLITSSVNSIAQRRTVYQAKCESMKYLKHPLHTFTSDTFGSIRTIMRNNNPWFVAADVCRALEITNPTDAIKKLDDDEKARLNLGLRGGDTNIINEPGLYSLVLGSRKPETKASA